MSERLPYEEQLQQQLRDFPLPDENAAWEDMRRRLEEDDDDGVIVWWRKGCAGWGLLLLGLLVLGWWIMYDSGVFSGSKEEQKKDSIMNAISVGKNNSVDTINRTPIQQQKADKDTAWQTDTVISQATILSQPSIAEKKVRQHKTDGKSKQADAIIQQPGKPIAGQPTPQKTSDSITVQDTIKFNTVDSTKTARKDSTKKQVKTDTTANSVKKTDSTKKKEIFFSAGLGLSQQIPVAGQKAVPYGSQGRKFSLADYIPSVYFRLNKKDKWFIQGEFRYGAPQYTKPLLYFEKVDTGTGGADPRTTTKRLQKTYYHQLPLSFNYYVSPEWSIGAGLVWNKFNKSVFEEAVRDPNSPPDSFISKQVMTSKQPQAEGLSSSYFQGLFETQYQWRRFSFGARYTFGLQPYIRFTLPGQPEQKERNRSLQVFLRYELWRSLKSK